MKKEEKQISSLLIGRKQSLSKPLVGKLKDRDKDGYPDIMDCNPDNPLEHGVFSSIRSGISKAVSKVKSVVSKPSPTPSSSSTEGTSKGGGNGVSAPPSGGFSTPPSGGSSAPSGGGGALSQVPTLPEDIKKELQKDVSTPSKIDVLRSGSVRVGGTTYTGKAIVPFSGGKTATQIQTETFIQAKKELPGVKRGGYTATIPIEDKKRIIEKKKVKFAEAPPSMISELTTKEKYSRWLKARGRSFFEGINIGMKETVMPTQRFEESRTGLKATGELKDIPISELPLLQQQKEITKKKIVASTIRTQGKRIQLENRAKQGEDINKLNREMENFINRENAILKSDLKKLEKDTSTKLAKQGIPLNIAKGAFIGAVSILAPPVGIAIGAGYAAKTALFWDEVKQSFRHNPQAFLIETGSFAIGGLVGGGLGGRIKTTRLKARVKKDIMKPVRLEGLEIKGKGKTDIFLKGKGEIADQPFFITSDQTIGKSGIGVLDTKVVTKTKKGYKITTYRGLTKGEQAKPTYVRTDKGLEVRFDKKGGKGKGVIRKTSEFELRKQYDPISGDMGVKVLSDKFLNEPLSMKRFASVQEKIDGKTYFVKGGELRKVRIMKEGGIKELFDGRVEAVIKKVPQEKPDLRIKTIQKGKPSKALKGLEKDLITGIERKTPTKPSKKQIIEQIQEQAPQAEVGFIAPIVEQIGREIVKKGVRQIKTRSAISPLSISALRTGEKIKMDEFSLIAPRGKVKPKVDIKVGEGIFDIISPKARADIKVGVGERVGLGEKTRLGEKTKTDIIRGREDTPRPLIPEVKAPEVPPKLFFRGEKPEFKKAKGYDVEVLRQATDPKKRRWERLNKTLLTQDSALSRGARESDRDISARFRTVARKVEERKVAGKKGKKGKVVKKAKVFAKVLDTKDKYYQDNIRKFRNYKVAKGKKIPLATEKIERAKYRLDKPGEKRQIRQSQGLFFGFKR